MEPHKTPATPPSLNATFLSGYPSNLAPRSLVSGPYPFESAVGCLRVEPMWKLLHQRALQNLHFKRY